jgi:hypothetical protein
MENSSHTPTTVELKVSINAMCLHVDQVHMHTFVNRELKVSINAKFCNCKLFL